MIWMLLTACTGVITLGPETPTSPGTAPAPVACEDVLPGGLSADQAWTVSLDGYGDWGGIHAFSPDGDQLVTALDVYDPLVLTVDTADGSTLTSERGEIYPWGRDEDWTVEVRGVDWEGGAVVSLDSGEVLVEDPALGDTWRGGHGVISGDGRRAVAVDCDSGTTTVRAWDVATGASLVTLAVAETCGWAPPGPALVVLDRAGETVFIGLSATGEVLRVGLAERTVDRWQAHADGIETEIWAEAGVVSLTLLPDEQTLVTVGADGWLRRWATDTLAQVTAGLPAGRTRVNENLYANPALTSPVAGSPDGSLLASVDVDGQLVLRRACDQQPLATLTTPVTETGWFEELGPVAVAFHPSGESIAVRYEGTLALWTLGG